MNIANERVMLLSVGAGRGRAPLAALFAVSPSFNMLIPDPYAKPLKGSYAVWQTLLMIQKNIKICFGKKNFSYLENVVLLITSCSVPDKWNVLALLWGNCRPTFTLTFNFHRGKIAFDAMFFKLKPGDSLVNQFARLWVALFTNGNRTDQSSLQVLSSYILKYVHSGSWCKILFLPESHFQRLWNLRV